MIQAPAGLTGARIERQACASESSLARSSSIVGRATLATPGIARTLSHSLLIAGRTAAISRASERRPSGGSCSASALTLSSWAFASRILGKASCAEVTSVIPASAVRRAPTEEFTWLARLTPPTEKRRGQTHGPGGLIGRLRCGYARRRGRLDGRGLRLLRHLLTGVAGKQIPGEAGEHGDAQDPKGPNAGQRCRRARRRRMPIG